MNNAVRPLLENAHRRDNKSARGPVFNLPGIVMALISLNVAIHFVRAWILSDRADLAFITRFSFLPLRYSGAGPIDFYAFIDPLTYVFLHGNIAHLSVNMIWLAIFGSPLANRIGAVRLLLLWAVTGASAALLHFMVYSHDFVPLIGASGATSGMMGAAARFAFQIDRSNRRRGSFSGPLLPLALVFRSRMVSVFLLVWMVSNLVVGLDPGGVSGLTQIAWEAHIGGFLAGFLAIRLFDRPSVP